jgi:hypothetical protein
MKKDAWCKTSRAVENGQGKPSSRLSEKEQIVQSATINNSAAEAAANELPGETHVRTPRQEHENRDRSAEA